MSRKLVNMRLPEDLLARTDAEAKRLGQTRTMFVERALESALAGGPTLTLPVPPLSPKMLAHIKDTYSPDRLAEELLEPDPPVANVLGSPVRKSRKTPSLKDTWGR